MTEPAALDEALRAFGEQLAARGYGWEAVITREGPSGEETVAHLTTANPDLGAIAALDVDALAKALEACASIEYQGKQARRWWRGQAVRIATEYAKASEAQDRDAVDRLARAIGGTG